MRRFVPVLFLLAWSLAFVGARSLFERDEGRYTAVALQMLRTGDWIAPRVHHETPHFTKPPLTYWAVASSLALFGRNPAAARLPGALAFFFTVLLVHALGKRFVPTKPSLPALVYATFLVPYVAAAVVTADTLLALWETLAVLAFARAWWAIEERTGRRWLLLMWVAFGLAFTTKGPPGLLPLLPIALFAGLAGGREKLAHLFRPADLAVFLLVALPWYLVVVDEWPGLLHYFFREELLARAVTGTHHRNPEWYGAFMIYGPTLLLGSLPWTAVLIRAASRGVSRLRRGPFRTVPREQPETLFLFLWFAVPAVLLFLARSRLPLYVLPLFAPLSLAVGRKLEGRFRLGRATIAGLALWTLVPAAGRLVPVPGSLVPDSLALARAIREQTRLVPDEVTFVEMRPYYGVSLHLGSQVEWVTFDARSDAGTYAQPETLIQEMTETDEAPFFVVPGHAVARFEAVVTGAGLQAVRVGGWRSLEFFKVEPQDRRPFRRLASR